ncbi:DUF2189 domain-containing protein [Acidovorax sp. sic0104]|uniref:DUF2189 domain-containing protein n=1 Tax=Acidovorax sp. sic0104 TaxID=2854784 RepID=UPI001C4601A4|nr:DUF2189 domain-containing protein [Acidovorax sp. sic0104]MBV7543867.1 DUF2189 domain-containing protein [Acidovorax sp. sic0104]
MTATSPKPVTEGAEPSEAQNAEAIAGRVLRETARPVTLQRLHPGDPFRWLLRGLQDVRAAPGIAVFYGACFWGMAMVLGWVFRARPEYTMSLASGCLLVGPFLAMGLYDTSRRREEGLAPQLSESLTCWDSHMGSMGMLVLVLVVLELLWGRASLVVFAVFFNTGMPSTTGVLQAVFNPQNWSFVAVYAVVGGVFAALVFSTSVVSIPMILDRDTDALTAGITSVRVVLENPAAMLVWGALITAIVGLSLWLWGLPLLLAGPLLGHASWHAYRACVAPPREILAAA